jgi:hypothetical protein
MLKYLYSNFKVTDLFMTPAEYLICSAWKEINITVLVQLRGTLYFKSEEGCQSGIGCGVK